MDTVRSKSSGGATGGVAPSAGAVRGRRTLFRVGHYPSIAVGPESRDVGNPRRENLPRSAGSGVRLMPQWEVCRRKPRIGGNGRATFDCIAVGERRGALRADIENRNHEFDTQFGLKGLCCRSFWGTKAACHFAICSDNLRVGLQGRLGQPQRAELTTLRWRAAAFRSDHRSRQIRTIGS